VRQASGRQQTRFSLECFAVLALTNRDDYAARASARPPAPGVCVGAVVAWSQVRGLVALAFLAPVGSQCGIMGAAHRRSVGRFGMPVHLILPGRANDRLLRGNATVRFVMLFARFAVFVTPAAAPSPASSTVVSIPLRGASGDDVRWPPAFTGRRCATPCSSPRTRGFPRRQFSSGCSKFFFLFGGLVVVEIVVSCRGGGNRRRCRNRLGLFDGRTSSPFSIT